MHEITVKAVGKAEADLYASLLVSHMRTEDREEEAYLGLDPYDDVCRSIIHSLECRAAWRTEKLLCVYGVAPAETPLIWMLATETVKEEPKQLVRIGYSFIHHAVMRYGAVSNYISAWNKPALRYIAGTRYIEDLQTELHPVEIGGKRLCHFIIRRKPCAESAEP